MNSFKSFIAKGKVTMRLLLGIAVMATTGCREEEPPMISANRENIQVGIEAQQYSVTVESNTYWTGSSNAGWLTLSKSEGYGRETIYLNISEYNDSPNPRTAIVEFKTKGSNQLAHQITVVQSAANSVLMISPGSIVIDNKPQNVGIAVASNETWTVSVDKESLVGTITPVSGDGNNTITVPVLANNDHEDRVITVTITAGTGNRTVQKTATITQKGMGMPTLFLTEQSLSFPVEGATLYSAIITNITGTITATCDFGWCNPTIEGTKVKIEVEANPGNSRRDAIVTVAGSVDGTAVSRQIRVTQAGLGSPDIILFPSNVSVPYEGQDGVIVSYIKVNSGVTVNVPLDINSDWISNIDHDSNTGTITFDVTPNTARDMRQCVINVVATVGTENIIYPVNVTQRGVGMISINLTKTQVNATSDEHTETVVGVISAPTAVVTAIVCDGPNGMIGGDLNNGGEATLAVANDGVFTLPIRVMENSLAPTRTATILLMGRMGAETTVFATITVIQAGIGSPDVIITNDMVTVPQTGATAADNIGTVLIGATKNTTIADVTIGDFTASAIKTSADPDAGVDFIGITAGPNNNVESRTQTIHMVAKQGGASQILILTVTQPGTGSPELMIPETNFTFPAAGVTGVSIVVSPVNGTDCTVVSYPSWITAPVFNTTNSTLDFDVPVNNTSETLTGTVILKATNSSTDVVFYSIGVMQKGLSAPALTLAATDVSATAIQTAIVIPVLGDESVIDVAAFGKFIDQPWITDVTYSAGNLEITLDPNTGADARSQTIKAIFKNKAGVSQNISIKVTQAGNGGPNVTPTETALRFGPAASVEPTDVYLFNNSDPVSEIKVTNKPSWVTATVNAGYDLLSVEVEENDTQADRSGVITLTAKKDNKTVMFTIAVTQAPHKPLGASLARYSVGVGPDATVGGSETRVYVMNTPDNATVTIADFSDSWLSASDVNGNSVLVSVDANTGARRSGTLIVQVEHNVTGEIQHLSLIVNQAAADVVVIDNLIVSPGTMTFEAMGASDQSLIFGNYVPADYTLSGVQVSDSWITTPTSDLGTDFTIKADDRLPGETSQRTGTVTLLVKKSNGIDQEIVINVIQKGVVAPTLTLAATEVSATATQTTIVIPVLGDVSAIDPAAFAKFINQAWITDMTYSANSLTITLAANTGTSTLSQTVKAIFKDAADNIIGMFDIKVSQTGINAPSMVPGATALQLGPVASSHEIFILNNLADPTTITRVGSEPAWITGGTVDANSVLTFDVDLNNTAFERSGVVTYTATSGGQTAMFTITVTQQPYGPLGVLLSNPSLIVGPEQIDINVYLNGLPGSGVAVSVVGNTYSWVNINTTTGIVSVDANTGARRSATLTILVERTDGEKQYLTLTVNQRAAPVADLIATPFGLNFAATSLGTKTVFFANYDADDYVSIIAQSSQDWIIVTNSTPITNEVIVDVDDRLPSEKAARAGTVKLTVKKSNGEIQTINITVTQNGSSDIADLILANPAQVNLSFARTGSPAQTVTFAGYNTTDYEIVAASSPQPTWFATLTFDNTNGSVTIGPNNSVSSRSTTVTVTIQKSDGAYQQITINVAQS